MAGLDAPLRPLVGAKSATALERGLGLHTVEDLLRHYPRRYEERGELTDLSRLRTGDHVTVLAEVEEAHRRPMRQRRGHLLEVVVTDGRSRLVLTFFNDKYHHTRLVKGRRGLFAGQVGVFKGTRQLVHPDYQLLGDGQGEEEVEEFAGGLIPVYPATAAMPSWRVAKAVRVALDRVDDLVDPLPAEVRRRHGLLHLAAALRAVHRPRERADVAAARARLVWDEAFLLQVALARLRARLRAARAVPRPPRDGGLLTAFDARLPFALTAGQREVAATLEAELADDSPMHRLLQGEVGSGKTVVALRAMLAVVDAGGQAALLAPTEVLAQQHHRSITRLLGPLAEAGRLDGADTATRVALLTGSLGAAARREALLEAASGQAGIVVGTHALLEERVRFAELGLVVVDEQHRFGVEQRDALRAKGAAPPHVLVMTATPIPRTVAMTVFGDLEVSTLRELPAGRASITTHVVPAAEKPAFLDRAWARVREEVAAGRQAYVVCPRIGDTDGSGDAPEDGDDTAAEPTELPARRPPVAALELAPLLRDGPLHGLRVGLLHGRLPAEEKDAVMTAFAAGEVDVLVATTVVEVGVDVANASVMLVMDADRFGVSQLHQLRGRVGRGSAPGLCLLVTETPPGSPARARLDAVAATLDGFALSRVDLETRREGDVLGASQSGRRSSLRLLSVLRDEDVIVAARAEATDLVAADPELVAYPALAAEVDALLAEERTEYLDKA